MIRVTISNAVFVSGLYFDAVLQILSLHVLGCCLVRFSAAASPSLILLFRLCCRQQTSSYYDNLPSKHAPEPGAVLEQSSNFVNAW